MYLLGYDLGSSSIKVCLLEAETGRVKAAAVSPATELEILAVRPGWAEQRPETWWHHVKVATSCLLADAGVSPQDIRAIGVCYQMHGLVAVDRGLEPLRPAIIWCDSRAVEIGDQAFREIGEKRCLETYLNSPGNFTASKLKWVKENEPARYSRIHKVLLPGDYLAMRLTGEVKTTPSGLSEGILWDYREQGLARSLLEHYGISPALIPEMVPTFSLQGQLTRQAAAELGLAPGTPVTYRSGDQPNNALSLNVLNPGEVAATAGTSGVVYGVAALPVHDSRSRVNTFVHVNHRPEASRYGILLCVNGTGILMRWLKHNLTGAAGAGSGAAGADGGARRAAADATAARLANVEMDYAEMNRIAAQAPAGSQGLTVLPYGNGAERTLENRDLGASVHGLNFNIHHQAHLLRAAQEGIVFALNYGLEIMGAMGIEARIVRAGHANLFLSPLFCEAFAAVCGTEVQLYNTDNAQGAARGAGLGAGVYRSFDEAFRGLEKVKTVEPDPALRLGYLEAYGRWRKILELCLTTKPTREPS